MDGGFSTLPTGTTDPELTFVVLNFTSLKLPSNRRVYAPIDQPAALYKSQPRNLRRGSKLSMAGTE